MNLDKKHSRYGSLLMAMHWIMLIMLVGVFACIELREVFPRGSEPRAALKTWHFMLGLSVFCLLWLRLLARVTTPTQPIIPSLPLWQRVTANSVEFTLYLFMFVMPVLGWSVLSAEGSTIPFWGFEFFALLNTDKELAKQLEEIHGLIGTAGYYLIGLHAMAALFHHYIRQDNVLLRMLPRRH
ncbi:cytochrome b [Alteromonas facilis]|uniref:cytochrome b n=1 Tax=Alteromonas facilis TaxID=2048004 RepID=UPI000C290B64|nr:cytochrome b [Alteromonas facilis]